MAQLRLYSHGRQRLYIVPRRKGKAMKFRQGESACKSLSKSFSEGKARSWLLPCCCPIDEFRVQVLDGSHNRFRHFIAATERL
jgi:hypothetical protein